MEPAPGNMVLIEGDREVKRFMRSAHDRVDDWLYAIVDEMVFYASERIRERAPGSIPGLVDIVPSHQTASGAFEGVAGVEPDITEETFSGGLGSDPADYPVFVEVGTGIFGPVGKPISTIPGHLMGPIFDPALGREIYVQTIQGQRPQHYVERSFDDLVEATPVMIRERLPDLARDD